MFNKSCFFGDLSEVLINRILAPTVGAKDGTLTLRAVTLVRPEQVVTCSAHSNEHFKTNLAEYWGEGGCTVGQVTSRTTLSVPLSSSTHFVPVTVIGYESRVAVVG